MLKKRFAILICTILTLSILLISCAKDPAESGGTEDSTVYYTVVFNSNGGTAVPSVQVPQGGRASEPNPPTLENRVFKGWMYNGSIWDFSRKVTEDMTLTASWENASEQFEYTVKDGCAIVTGLKHTKDSSVVIPTTISGFTVTAIGDSAFADITVETVTSISLPATVTSIGAYAFQGCEGIAITVAGALTSLGENAFEECDLLRTVSLGEGLTEIPPSTFLMCVGLTSVSLPTTLTKIDESAFEGCENLATLLMHKGVTEIGHSAFRDCDALTTLLFGGTNEEYEALTECVVPTMNDPLLLLDEICFYSETEPDEEGRFWHYDENRMPKIW